MATSNKAKREIAHFTINLELPVDKKDKIEELKKRVNLSKKFLKSTSNVEWLSTVLNIVETSVARPATYPVQSLPSVFSPFLTLPGPSSAQVYKFTATFYAKGLPNPHTVKGGQWRIFCLFDCGCWQTRQATSVQQHLPTLFNKSSPVLEEPRTRLV